MFSLRFRLNYMFVYGLSSCQDTIVLVLTSRGNLSDYYRMGKDLKEITAVMEKAVMAAAKHLSCACSSKDKIKVHSKPDHTIVMNLDLECQEAIVSVLGKNEMILAEEDENSHDLIGSEKDFFIVDPIDGTASCRRYMGIEGGQIGFGPLVGYAEKGHLSAAVYYNMPGKTLYSASLGQGAYALTIEAKQAEKLPSRASRKILKMNKAVKLSESALLFYPGSMQELKTVMHWRTIGLVENTYRLGGFANDCIRLAEGFEQIELQSRVKAWDFTAVMIAKEAGLEVIIDPYDKKISFEEWVINKENPVLIAHHEVIQNLLDNLQG